jgi:hypothetical protein
MGFDVVLIAVIVGGLALSAAYVRAEYLGWREHRAAERRRAVALRDLHATSLSEQHNALLLPSVVKLQGFGAGEAANPLLTDCGYCSRTPRLRAKKSAVASSARTQEACRRKP